MTELDAMVERCPVEDGILCELYDIGDSYEGRPLRVLRVRYKIQVLVISDNHQISPDLEDNILCELFDIGDSYEGRTLRVVRVR